MNKTLLKKTLSRFIATDLPSKCVFGDREITVTVMMQKYDRTFSQYGPDNHYSKSIIVCVDDMPDFPKRRDLVVLDGQNYRVMEVTNQADISLVIDLERE